MIVTLLVVGGLFGVSLGWWLTVKYAWWGFFVFQPGLLCLVAVISLATLDTFYVAQDAQYPFIAYTLLTIPVIFLGVCEFASIRFVLKRRVE